MTMPIYGGRLRTDKRAAADRAAIACTDEGVTRRDAMARFRIGWTYLRQAIARLRAERAGGRP
jgi:hypothetical protein